MIWSVAPGPDGALYAATGNRGRVFRIEQNGTRKLLWTADRPEVFAIAVDKKGVVYAASSPDGKIYRIENGKATEYFDPKTKYIWSLALADDGTLYAGTGDDGRVFRITGAGKGEAYYATGQGNVTGLMIDQRRAGCWRAPSRTAFSTALRRRTKRSRFTIRPCRKFARFAESRWQRVRGCARWIAGEEDCRARRRIRPRSRIRRPP